MKVDQHSSNGAYSDPGENGDAKKLAMRNRFIKEEIAAVRERIEGLKAIAGKQEYLSIPTTVVSNPAPVVIVDTELRLREANESFAMLTDLTSADLPFGTSALALFAEESRPRMQEAMTKLVQSGLVEPFESELLRREGTNRPVIVCMTKMAPTNNDCFVYFLDMADRKAMQKELAIKQSNLAALAEAIPQLVWVSGEDGALSYANGHFRHYTGVSLDSAAMNWQDLLSVEDKESFSGPNFSLAKIVSERQAEVRLRDAQGAYLWHLLKVVPFEGTVGAAKSWLVIATEIDEQKRLTESLLVAEEQLRLIADAMPQIVWTANAQGLVDFLNHRWFEYTGLTGEQSLHGGWRLLIHSEDLPKYEASWQKAVKAGEPFEVEFRLKRVLGLGGRKDAQSAYRAKTSGTKSEPRRDYLWHLCRAVPLKTSQGFVVRWFGTWTEIDEHKAKA